MLPQEGEGEPQHHCERARVRLNATMRGQGRGLMLPREGEGEA
jgi:hypothetical protein